MIQPQPLTASRKAFHGFGVRCRTVDTSLLLHDNEPQEYGPQSVAISEICDGEGTSRFSWASRSARRRATGEGDDAVGQVKAQVRLTNAREAVLAQLGHLQAAQVHHVDTEALIDTGAVRSVLPPFVAEQLGLVRLDRTMALYADGRGEEVDFTEPFIVDISGRRMTTSAMVLG